MITESGLRRDSQSFADADTCYDTAPGGPHRITFTAIPTELNAVERGGEASAPDVMAGLQRTTPLRTTPHRTGARRRRP
ncbi:hypothetical protein ACFXPQ_04690 [Streptomyces lydicus]|uniref:hypothetical protein n=1 Tax=Streptomyces lydicus TaxID=47763 RepID=UPI0036CF68BD